MLICKNRRIVGKFKMNCYFCSCIFIYAAAVVETEGRQFKCQFFHFADAIRIDRMNETTQLFKTLPELSRIGSFGFLFGAILIGVFLSLFINMGPAFLTLVQTSLHYDFRSAAWFALGVLANDAMIISLCVLTSVQVVLTSHQEIQLFIIGAGIILLIFGLYTFRRKVDEEKVQQQVDENEKKTQAILEKKNPKRPGGIFFGKGFAMNILNPFVWFFWFSAVAVVAGNTGGSKINTLLFFAIALGSCLAVDLLKAKGASALKRFFNSNRINIMNKMVGIALMLFGLYFIIVKGILTI